MKCHSGIRQLQVAKNHALQEIVIEIDARATKEGTGVGVREIPAARPELLCRSTRTVDSMRSDRPAERDGRGRGNVKTMMGVGWRGLERLGEHERRLRSA